MELLTFKVKDAEYTYYLSKNGEEVRHGEQKFWYANGQLWSLSYWCHGKCHGEYKVWNHLGSLKGHCFYINDKPLPCVEMNDQEKLLFQIKHPGFKFLDDV